MRVALVGGAGLVGRALCRALRARGDQPIVLDVGAPPAELGARAHRVDILRDDVKSALAAAAPDVVVHLVARVDPPRAGGRAAMRALHVEGTRRVVQAARAIGVARFVLVSSSVVYGARPTHTAPLDERAPVAPLASFPYAVDKAAQEEVARIHAGPMPVVVVRPAIVYAPDARSYLTEILRHAPGILPAIDGCRPPLDFVHVDDVAGAIVALASIVGDVRGPFNIASRAPMAYEDVARIARLRLIDLPRALVAPVLDVGARFAPHFARAPSYILDHLMYPFVTDARALRERTGFASRATSEDALRAMLGARARARDDDGDARGDGASSRREPPKPRAEL